MVVMCVAVVLTSCYVRDILSISLSAQSLSEYHARRTPMLWLSDVTASRSLCDAQLILPQNCHRVLGLCLHIWALGLCLHIWVLSFILLSRIKLQYLFIKQSDMSCILRTVVPRDEFAVQFLGMSCLWCCCCLVVAVLTCPLWCCCGIDLSHL